MKDIKFTIGFSGSRKGMTERQLRIYNNFLNKLAYSVEPKSIILRHGCCHGADLQAAEIFRKIFPISKIIQHPPTNMRLATINTEDIVLPSKDYLDRNRDIVDCCTLLIATPSNMNQYRSGTWATIRYADRKNKLLEIIEP